MAKFTDVIHSVLDRGFYFSTHWPDVPLSLVNESQKANKKSAEKSSIKQSQNLL